MCGRYTLTDPDPRMLQFRFGVSETAEVEQEARYNVAPTDTVLAVRTDKEGKREAGRLRWGLIPHYADPDSWDRLLINARAETVAEAPAFRDAFDGFRCLIVADGFYEWRASETGKQPLWITGPTTRRSLSLACGPARSAGTEASSTPARSSPASRASWLRRSTTGCR